MTRGKSRPILYREFSQMVRRYPRDELLTQLSQLAVTLERKSYTDEALSDVPGILRPFSIAGIAKAAVMTANNYRPTSASAEDLLRLCGAYVEIEDPDVVDSVPGDERLAQILLRVGHEQFGGQLSLKEDLGRTWALLHDHAIGVAGAPSANDWAEVLGVRLEEFMRIGFALYTAAMHNPGSVTRDLLASDHVMPIFRPLDKDAALGVIDKHFVHTLDQMKAWGSDDTRARRGREKWCPNPIQNRPVIDTGGLLLMPVLYYVLNKVTPTGLYFVGLDAFDTRFTDALGLIFESYVGAQLRELGEHVRVEPEIVYGPHGEKTCDYFLITPECVVLVEVKTARPTLDMRVGENSGFDDARRKLLKARDQLNNTAKLIEEGKPAFAEIPRDRPIRRMIVTLEPFWLRHTFADNVIFGDDLVPVPSAHDLEAVVGILAGRDDIGARLLKALETVESRSGDLVDAIRDLEPKHNRIIAEAWDTWAEWHPPA